MDRVVQDLCETLRASVETDVLASKPDDRGRIALLLENANLQKEVSNRVEGLLNDPKNLTGKDRTKALSFKELGNAAFGKRNHEEALHLYNKSIAWMPQDGSKDLSLLFANRSAALFHMGHISLAQKDVKLAFSLNYPTELHYKLYERSGRCFLRQGNKSEANRMFKLAISALQNSTLEEAKLTANKKLLEDLIKSGSADCDRGKSEAEANVLPDVSGGENKILRSASRKLSLCKSEKAGRYVVANETFQPGDVILVQKAFVSCLSPEFYHQHCYHCFAHTHAPVPCKTCSFVSYCSEECQKKSWTSHHKYECKIVGVLGSAGISITCYMALRLVLQTGMVELNKWLDLLRPTDSMDESNNEGQRGAKNGGKTSGKAATAVEQVNEEYPADFASLFQLVTHSRQRETEDIFQRTIMAIFLLTLIKTTGFLPPLHQKDGDKAEESNNGINSNRESKGANEDELAVGTVLLRSLQFLQFNAHEIAAWDGDQAKSVFLGGGLFLTLALFNHSCDPAIVRYFVNDTVVVRAVRTIYKGEQVTENYGPIFTASRREERRATLASQYWFQCQCICCQEDWPTFENMVNDMFSFRCRFCHRSLGKSNDETALGLLLECRYCSRPTNILKSLKDLQASEGEYTRAMDFMAKGRESAAVGILLQNIALLDSILLPPFRDYHLCQEAVRKCFLSLGNKTFGGRKGISSATSTVIQFK